MRRSHTGIYFASGNMREYTLARSETYAYFLPGFGLRRDGKVAPFCHYQTAFMRRILFPLAAALFAISSAHAASTPTKAQIQSAIDKGIAATQAKSTSSVPMPLAITVFDVVGCKPSPAVQTEVVCLIGMSTSRRDAYRALALRQDGDTWVGVERKDAAFPPPTPAEAQQAIRTWAEELAAKDPEAAKDAQVQEARTTMTIKALQHCDVERKTGYLVCDTVMSIPGKDDVSSELKYALEGDVWKFAQRK